MKDKLKKRWKSKAGKASIGIVCILVLAIIGGVMIHRKNAAGGESEVTVQSATAEKGSISTSVVGTGTLQSAETTDITVPAGVKIKEVLVESGDKVTKGQKLATVTEASVAEVLLEIRESIEDTEDAIDNLSDDADDSATTEYLEAKVLAGRLAELEEAEETLETLLETQTIKATTEGVISNVYVSADTEVEQTAESSSDSSSANSQTDTTKVAAGAGKAEVTLLSTDTETKERKVMLLSTDDASDSFDQTTGGTQDTSDTRIKITDCSIEVAAPVTGGTPQTELSDSDYFKGTISWNCSTETFQEDTVYTATIKLTAREGYVFSSKIIPEVRGADVTYEVLESDGGESILKIKAKFAKTAAASDSTGNGDGSSATGSKAEGNSQSGTASDSAGQKNSAKSYAGGSVSGNVSGSVSAGSSSSGAVASTSSSASASEDVNVYEATAFSVSSEEKIAVSVNVDELDIQSIAEGQKATVTLDALEDEEFEGEITSVSSTASSSGSSVKYPVEIQLDKTDEMLLGMSASATIIIDETQDAVVIPVSALQEQGNKTFVYTETDSEGNLSGETEVETGLSNESQVEIVSGLSEGDTVYYLKTSGSDADSMMNGEMPFGEMPSGEMPSGEMPSGEMPSGGMPSGGGRGDRE